MITGIPDTSSAAGRRRPARQAFPGDAALAARRGAALAARSTGAARRRWREARIFRRCARIVLARFQQEGRIWPARRTIHKWSLGCRTSSQRRIQNGQMRDERRVVNRRTIDRSGENRKRRLINNQEAHAFSSFPIRRGLDPSRRVTVAAMAGIRLVVLFVWRLACRGSDPSPAIGKELARNSVRRT